MSTTVLLTSSLTSPYPTILSLLLFLPALPILFTSTFLTLSRTRSFPPIRPSSPVSSLDSETQPPKRRWRFEGGVGGTVAGWLFGVHLCVWMDVLVANRAGSALLAPAVLLVLSVLAGTLSAVLCARFRVAAYIMASILGGATLTMLLTAAFQPSLLVRLIFLALLIPPLVVLSVLPIIRSPNPTATLLPLLQHASLRTSLTASASFTLYASIALLCGPSVEAWANMWVWLAVDGDGAWGSAGVKGLSAAAWITFVLGMAADWAICRKFGEDPSEKWDAYVATYALPSVRAGVFNSAPPRSLLSRLRHPFASSAALNNNILFPPTSDLLPVRSQSPFHPLPPRRRLTLSDHFAKAAQIPARGRTLLEDEDSAYDDSLSEKYGLANTRRVYQASLEGDSMPPRLEGTEEAEGLILQDELENGVRFEPDHASHRFSPFSEESDISDALRTPPFRQSPIPSSLVPGVRHTPAPIPATPSLIRALERVARAHEEAFGPRTQWVPQGQSQMAPKIAGPQRDMDGLDQGWDDGFWDEVRRAAGV